MAEVMQIKPDSTFLASVPEPQVPDPTISFSPLDCVPLPSLESENEAPKENETKVQNLDKM